MTTTVAQWKVRLLAVLLTAALTISHITPALASIGGNGVTGN